MQFDNNKVIPVHQWYPFVEGYSKEFISSILAELDYLPECALDPFAGSGTTPVELQVTGIKCVSFEVSPFMHLLATVKLDTSYLTAEFDIAYRRIEDFLSKKLRSIRQLKCPPLSQTIEQRSGLKKWVFHSIVMDAVLDIGYAISLEPSTKYQKLFSIGLASILLDVSNVYRNGKCVSYKKGWQERKHSRREVHKKFLNKLAMVIRPDIAALSGGTNTINNSNYCIHGDVREGIATLTDSSVDLVITSPPYLNSRDYTDIYIVELWVLNLINNYDQLKQLRHKTFISHVQVKHGEIRKLDLPVLDQVIRRLNDLDKKLWNVNIPTMIKGYFADMDNLFRQLSTKMRPGKKVYFNVANSAYGGIEIKVDEIVASIAGSHGFIIEEIREARRLKTSGQQKAQIKSLRESVIVMTSPYKPAHAKSLECD